MATPLVSVIIPTYNRAYCLPRTLDSVLGQTHTHFEVVLIDDGSTDETRDLVTRAYSHDSRIKYFYQPNSGLAAARNQGLIRSHGEYIALLDSDDVWMPWKLDLQLACFRQCPKLGMVWTDMHAIGPDGLVRKEGYLRTMYHAYRWFSTADLFPETYALPEHILSLVTGAAQLHVGGIFSHMLMGNMVHSSTVMLSRDRVEKVGKFDLSLSGTGEDYQYYLRASREGPVGLVDVASILYQIGMPDRLTQRMLRIAQDALATVKEVLRQDSAKIDLPRSMIRARLAELHLWVGEQLLAHNRAAEARKHLVQSLRQHPAQPRAWALLAQASLPAVVGDMLKHSWRSIKKAAPIRTKY
jgi:GT2 family glycosyltransferase